MPAARTAADSVDIDIGARVEMHPGEADTSAAPALRQTDWPSFPIVGVGASAGGLEAFTQLLTALPPAPGVAIVFIQHLLPNRDSMLAELLANSSAIPVVQIRDRTAIAIDHVYVAPPSAQIEIIAEELRVIPRPTDVSQYSPIDHFFRSLAESAQSHAIGVVLSGTASDGSVGILEIKAAGGIVIVQDPTTAKFDGMPRAAVNTGAVDLTLPLQEIAQELARISHHPFIRHLLPRAEADQTPIIHDQLARIFTLLRNATGVDFTHYKPPTIKRRLQRRMVLHKISSIDQYVAYLQKNPDEVHSLYRDLLIHVTRFFREPDSYQALSERVFPSIIANRNKDDAIRIWVPGCATGEEPYSVAIALTEYLGEQAGSTAIQIFATDISDTSIGQARAGVYQDSISADVSADRLRRFFVRTDGGYRISKNIRDMCVFARQDLTRDPPFSRLDLVVCRNVLIYLSALLQKRLMNVFHYALKPTGYLMLGAAETIGPHADLFSLVDKRRRLYGKKLAPMRSDLHFAPNEHAMHERAGRSTEGRKSSSSSVQNEANRFILDRYSPPAVVVDDELRVVYVRGQTGRYLEPAPGEATLNVLKMAREGLLPGLRSAVAEARHSANRARRQGLHVRSNGDSVELNLEVVPVEGSFEGRHFLILFEEVGKPGPAVSAPPPTRPARRSKRLARDSGRLAKLEQELAASREYLQSIIQDLEAANEELQSANEEILSSNEELQSTNEELDTAKEELQSTNEELNTVNEELHNRNEELSRTNSDLMNLLGSVQIAIVIVSGDLRIRRFTPMAEKVLNLIPADVGRRISDIKPNIECPELERLITEAVDSVTTVEREVRDRQGTLYALRIRPYKNLENRIDGAILALFDIDAAQRRGRAADGAEQVSAAIIDGTTEPLVLLDARLRIRHANAAFLRQFSLPVEGTINRSVYDVGGHHWDESDLRLHLNEVLSGAKTVHDWRMRIDATAAGGREVHVTARRLPAGDGPGTTAVLLRFGHKNPAT